LPEIRSGEWKRRQARNSRAIIEHAKQAATPPEQLGYTAYVEFDEEREARHKLRIQQFCKRLGHDVLVTTQHVTGPNGERGIQFTPVRRNVKFAPPARLRLGPAPVSIVRRISTTPRPRAAASRVRRRHRSKPGSNNPHEPDDITAALPVGGAA
jgi:hypothetical protein